MIDSAGEGQGTAFDAPLPTERADLARLVATAGQDPFGTLELLLRRADLAQAAFEHASGTEHLFFICADVACALPLTALREVLNLVPRAVPLPFSPDWLLGIFPLRSEMLGLVDPAPFLFGHLDGVVAAVSLPGQQQQANIPDSVSSARRGQLHAPALVVGTETRSLALAVRAIGEIVRIGENEVQPRSSALATGAPPCTEAYLAGIYRPQDGSPPRIILDVDHLLGDLLSALEEKDERYG